LVFKEVLYSKPLSLKLSFTTTVLRKITKVLKSSILFILSLGQAEYMEFMIGMFQSFEKSIEVSLKSLKIQTFLKSNLTTTQNVKTLKKKKSIM
jgi:hypothetical protein